MEHGVTGYILNSGLRISEALRVKVRDVRLTDGVARSVRVIGKKNKERLVPLRQEGHAAQASAYLRHTAARSWRRVGGSTRCWGTWTTQIYTHVSEDRMAGVMARL